MQQKRFAKDPETCPKSVYLKGTPFPLTEAGINS